MQIKKDLIATGVNPVLPDTIKPQLPPANQRDFSEVLDKAVKAMGGEDWNSISSELKILESSRPKVNPYELIKLQMRMGEMGLKVELFSKLADGLIGSLKKLQQQQ